MAFNQWGTFNQWSANAEPLIINAALGASTTQGFSAAVSINGQPVIISAAVGSTYSTGYRANVTIGTVTINIYPSTHYEIPNYY